MKIDGNQARAARAAKRREPVEYAIGDETFVFKSEMPLDVLFGVESVMVRSLMDLRLWWLAHLVVDAACDTSCVDATEDDEPARGCQAQRDLHERLRKVRVEGEPLEEADLDDMWAAVRGAQGVSEEGESNSSAGSSETAGDTSSETSDTATTRPTSSSKGTAASVA